MIQSASLVAALLLLLTATPTVTPTGSLSNNRTNHTATLLPSGRVLVVGGGGFPCTGNFCYSSTNNTAELYDPATGTWRMAGTLNRRSGHSATLLPNGLVLVVGGVNFGYDIGRSEYINTAELYDPVTEVWRPTQTPNVLQGINNAVLLPSGKVLVVGQNGPAAELFDPATETWRLTATPSRSGSLALLQNGNVLMAGNGAVELYDPATETWRSAGNFNSIAGVSTLTVLRNGHVLATGTIKDWAETAAEIYDPLTMKWKLTGSPKYRRSGGTATLLLNGSVVLAGGQDPHGEWPEIALRSLELYDPASGTWIVMPSLSTRRAFHTATMLPNDKVLFAGGIDGDGDVGTVWNSSAELFDLGLPRPTSLSIVPDKVSQGECFTMIVGNGSNMTLNIQYRLNGGPVQTLTGWPRLNENARAENICTSLSTPVGTFEFIAIRNIDTTEWLTISTSITVTN